MTQKLKLDRLDKKLQQIQNIRRNNLIRLIETKFNGSVYAFAKEVERSAGYFYDILSEKRPVPGHAVLRDIEERLELVPLELDQEGVDNFEEKRFESINVYPSVLSSNTNDIFSETAIDQISLNTADIKRNHWVKEYLCCFDVTGNSMEPILPDGARILVNTAIQALIDGKIYVLRKGSEIFIKRLYKLFDEGKFIAKSDNPLYPELQIDLNNKHSDLKIIGMAVQRLSVPL